MQNAPRHDPIVKAALDEVDLAAWMTRYPFRRGDSPLSAVPEYEDCVFDQAEKSAYGSYWKAIGLNTEEHVSSFADVPVCFLSGWYDVYARSTIDFYVNVSKNNRKSPVCLIMGPWSHGTEDHISGEVDFGTAALVSGNLAKDPMSLSREWFDRFVKPAVRVNEKGVLTRLTSIEPPHPQITIGGKPPLASTASDAKSPAAATNNKSNPSNNSSTAAAAAASTASTAPAPPVGPYVYHLPNRRTKKQKNADPLPPNVRYFRMGGGDGHRTSRGKFNHGGRWYASPQWPPAGTTSIPFYLEYLYNRPDNMNGQPLPQPQYPRVLIPESKLLPIGAGISKAHSTTAPNTPAGSGATTATGSGASAATGSGSVAKSPMHKPQSGDLSHVPSLSGSGSKDTKSGEYVVRCWWWPGGAGVIARFGLIG